MLMLEKPVHPVYIRCTSGVHSSQRRLTPRGPPYPLGRGQGLTPAGGRSIGRLQFPRAAGRERPERRIYPALEWSLDIFQDAQS